MWSDARRREALKLVESGCSDREIARRTGVPRATVGSWRRNPSRSPRFRSADPLWRPAAQEEYCYLLGLYLGDGHIVRTGRSARIAITLDSAHAGVMYEAASALAAVFPHSPVGNYRLRDARAIELRLSDSSLPHAFPQCGPGRKHHREIRLRAWQRELTTSHPRALLRGLIHSDGCRSLNRVSTMLPSGRTATYVYPRYFFSNLSADIREIFCEHCDMLGIRWTMSNARNVSISRRDSVALLDEFVGPKT